MKYLFYGCSRNLKFTLEKFDIDYSIIDFTDSNINIWNSIYIKEKKIIPPQEINVSDYFYCIIGAQNYTDEITNNILEMGFKSTQIIPYQYIKGLWERWRKSESLKLWEKSQTNQDNIKIIKNWHMEQEDAVCVLSINDLIYYDFFISAFDFYSKPKFVEVYDLLNYVKLDEFSTRDRSQFLITSKQLVIKIVVKKAISGIPWISFEYEKSNILSEIEQLRLGKEFIDIYSTICDFPYYDEDYIVISKLGKCCGGVILDVGANYGQSLLAFYNMVNSKIISFEVSPDLYDILKKLKKIIDVDDRIEIINCGISEKKETLVWYEPENQNADICGSFDVDFIKHRNLDVNFNKKNIQCKALDDFVKDYNDIWFIKMDVEGFEYEALKGARNIIANNYPVILIEQNEKIEDIKELLKEEYDVFYYDIYSDKFNKNRISRLNCWLIPKEDYRSSYVNELLLGRI